MFESLASCFAAYKPSCRWRKSCRLRGFAFRCSASLNMTAALQNDFQTITRNFYSRLLNLSAFVGARHENRVRVVDVDVNLPARWRWTQHIKATVVDGRMIHLARAASARPYLTEFSVAPERPVKHDKIRC